MDMITKDLVLKSDRLGRGFRPRESVGTQFWRSLIAAEWLGGHSRETTGSNIKPSRRGWPSAASVGIHRSAPYQPQRGYGSSCPEERAWKWPTRVRPSWW